MTTDPDFSPVTGNRIRPLSGCLCSTCTALRSGEPDATPKEKPPTAGPKPRLFTIHLVDRDPMPDAPPDPTPAIVAGMIETVNREIERGLAGLRRERDEALAAVEEWKGAAVHWGARCDEVARERDAALEAENAAELQRRLMRDDRNALIEDMGGARDRAIAERDEARKALADEKARGSAIGIAGCNLKAGSHVVWMDSAELAALRRERDAAQSQWRALQSEIEGRDADRAEIDALRARVAELEAAAGTRDKRIIALCARINQIGALANCD